MRSGRLFKTAAIFIYHFTFLFIHALLSDPQEML
ncbi:hypothetical protein HDEF_2094 [Candidatus Hamiltonella defensa 5AT (Acyrthosiphon pisum)]|uniref:Uncharacterized protein n=1 Tax=Hamiltonella defensa subsp. Acyrthosiphon pisum (strain 5AT) TaxID=572265 RepID=C4K7W7_HAMD5|nr:hypothetical protein HDEF_2094 [Candidatus Hamiltonella defensa 5AT (Acyrthosiphon pisum)]